MRSFKNKNKIKCLSCDKEVDAHTGYGHNHSYLPGDLLLCVYCGQWMKFAPDLSSFEPLDAADREIVNTDPDCARAEEFVAGLISKRRNL